MPAPRRSLPLRNLALVVVGPLLLAGFGLVHPGGLRPSTAEAWAELHIWLIPVWPLLALGLIVPLYGRRPRRDAAGVATVVAWVAAFGYATFYTGLDAVAGIAAGLAEQHGGAHPRTVVNPLFHTGGALGEAGVVCFGVGVIAASVALFLRHGVRVLPGAGVLLVCCWSFYDSHIFMPRGVVTMLGFALGFALLVWAAAARREPSRPTSPAS
ncbi:MAG: hypothetical protein ACRDP3_07780 [Streptomyces sp.]|uniref:hypothetical protein n=1 Tax=Streptomyces sp. TaxID=1931 RepID=UPI003D6B1F80